MYSFTYTLLGSNTSMLPTIKKIIIVSIISLISSLCYSSEWGSKEETDEKLFSVEVIDSSAQTNKDNINDLVIGSKNKSENSQKVRKGKIGGYLDELSIDDINFINSKMQKYDFIFKKFL